MQAVIFNYNGKLGDNSEKTIKKHLYNFIEWVII